MISINVPGISQIIQKVLMGLIYMDLLLVDLWMPQTLEAINGNQT
jgi:hypothetical protein